MHLFEYDSDPIRPDACELLGELGVNVDCVRDALADDRARSCPFPESSPVESRREAEEG